MPDFMPEVSTLLTKIKNDIAPRCFDGVSINKRRRQ
jgi:hypothetical protein